jgi:hypothetical protein
MVVAAGLVLAALTALAWWLSGRWLERPHAAPERNGTPKSRVERRTPAKTSADLSSPDHAPESAKIART